MHALIRPLQRLLALMLLVVMLGSLPLPVRTYAQQPQPATETAPAAEQASPTEPAVTADQSPPAAQDRPLVDRVVVSPDKLDEELEKTRAGLKPSAAPAQPAAAPAPAASAQAIVPGTQGVVTMDISVVENVRPGELVTYTYAYRNTGPTAISNLKIQVNFTDFTYFATFGRLQWCSTNPETTCGLLNVVGPALTNPVKTQAGDGLIFTVATIQPNQSGTFSMILRTNAARFPLAGVELIRPAGSARTFLGETPDSDDSASSLVTGPVFYLRKAAQATPVYPLQTGVFTITLGNATGPGDTTRPDAIRATNVVLKDQIPGNAEFVSASVTPQIEGNILTWTFPSLNVNASIAPIIVRYRVLDVDIECGTVVNRAYWVTSNEMPIQPDRTRAVVGGPEARFPVRIPIETTFFGTPNVVTFEHTTVLSFTVKNYYNQPIVGARFQYDIQTNAFYVANSASPSPTSAPTDPSLPGGSVIWTFDIAAGSITRPSVKGFSVTLKAGNKRAFASGTRRVILPQSIPSACVKAEGTAVDIVPRVVLTAGTTAPESTRVAGVYIVRRDQQFEYTIDVQNFGLTTVNSLVVTDTLGGLDFSYVPGSAVYGTTPREPQVLTTPQGKRLQWNNLTIAPGTIVQMKYKVVVRGVDYAIYCNAIDGLVLPSEEVGLRNGTICVKINPDIEVTKTANKTRALGGELVEFTIKLQNHEDIAYEFGIVDIFEQFTYVRTIRSYGNFQPSPGTGSNTLQWPITSIPPGGIIEVVVEARMPGSTPCVPDRQANLALFRSVHGYIYPPTVALVDTICTRLDHSAATDRVQLSLYDRFSLFINFANLSADVATNLVITNVLPLGFTYDGMHIESPIATQPVQTTRPDGRKVLKWTMNSLASNQSSFLRFYARSSATVGLYENWSEVSASNRPVVVCNGSCRLVQADGRTYALLGLDVKPLITMEPTITPVTCATQGSLRTYKLLIANTNVHDYNAVVIQVQLPMGLEYVRTLGTNPALPAITVGSNGDTTVRWTGRRVPAKPEGQTAGILIIEMELRVGEVWGALDTVVQTTSVDGLIPRKDGALDPTIYVCPPSPAYSKVTGRKLARIGDQVVFIISVANPGAAPFTVSFRDELPSGMSYVRMDSGPAPTQSGNVLTWTNLSVPGKVGEVPGAIQLRVVARLNTGANGSTVTNTATVTSSSVTVNVLPRNTASFRIAGRTLYLPRVLTP